MRPRCLNARSLVWIYKGAPKMTASPVCRHASAEEKGANVWHTLHGFKLIHA